jgi:type IV secretory pathway TrbL component
MVVVMVVVVIVMTVVVVVEVVSGSFFFELQASFRNRYSDLLSFRFAHNRQFVITTSWAL